ncbi:MAG: hypothetical protein J6W76_04695, partial [Spirochaetales bacterium]|nr:hypothetical protein [Spirochaetales bacterium]
TTYPIAGDNVVDKIAYSDGNVYINKTQYFGNVPAAVWECYIGGYQPLQKYLKDRKGRVLAAEEIMHWHRIVVALSETMRIMNELG